MNRKRAFTMLFLILAALHLIIACAGFFATYNPEEQNRELPFAPPMRLRFFDGQGYLHARPFAYPLRLREGSFDEYEEDRAVKLPLHFFVSGARYRLFGFLPMRLHLIGAEAQVHLAGTDGLGRDLFSRILFGGQISILAGLLATGLALFFGWCIGAAAGFYGGWIDEILMRCAELFLALPWLYLLFALRAFLPLTLSPLHAFFLVVGIIGAVGWARPARLVRGIVLSAKEREYVRAARGFGASPFYLLWRHILPQTRNILLTQAAILIPQYVLAEVTLSFLGLGVPEPTPSWGNLLSSSQQYRVLASYWWMLLPGFALVPFFLGYLGLASSLQEQGAPSNI